MPTQEVVGELGCVSKALKCGIHKAGIASARAQPRNELESVHSQIAQAERSRLD